jgi:hypothetical protein
LKGLVLDVGATVGIRWGSFWFEWILSITSTMPGPRNTQNTLSINTLGLQNIQRFIKVILFQSIQDFIEGLWTAVSQLFPQLFVAFVGVWITLKERN